MKHVLAIDEGTTGVTCLVVADDGRVVGRGYREITQHYPQPGWVEHDADEIVRHTIDAGRDAIGKAGVTPEAIGITNQRETVVVWDRQTGRPLHRAIVWQDRRTADRCAALAPKADLLSARTGLVVDPYFSATKLEWLLTRGRLLDRYEPERLAAGTIDSWLVWQLTRGAVHATDPTNASRTLLFDIDAMKWSFDLCALFGVPPSMLPEVRPSSGAFGVADGNIFGAEIPLLGVAGDQQAALYGQGCWFNGEGKNTYGTGAFLLMNTGQQRPQGARGLLTTVACDAAGRPAYALEASIFIAGAAVQWLRDGLKIIGRAEHSGEYAAKADPAQQVYLVPAFVGLGAPHWDADARGAIFGLTRNTGPAEFAKAALQSVAFQTRDLLDAMTKDWPDAAVGKVLRADGGMVASDWTMQALADILAVPVDRPKILETTALGAAWLAGSRAGVWPSQRDFAKSWALDRRFEPSLDEATRKRAIKGWRDAVRRTLTMG
jgi:glycerol kinase